MKYGGVEIDANTRFRELADDALLGRVGDSRSSTDNSPLDWLYRVWPRLPANISDKLGEAIGDAVHQTKNAEVQYNGLMFLTQHPQKGAWPHLQDLATNPGLLMDAPASAGDYTMRFWLIRAIASLAEDIATSALRFLEIEALSPTGTVGPALHTLINKDGTWWATHRDQVLRLHPEERDTIETIEAQ